MPKTIQVERDSHHGMIAQTLTVQITSVEHSTLLRWLANSVHHDTDEGTATTLLEQALDSLKKRMEQPI